MEITPRRTPRRGVWLTMALAGTVTGTLLAGCSAPSANVAAAPTTVPALPTKPVTLTVLDVSGDLSLTKQMFQSYAQQHANLVSKIQYETGSPTDVAGKVQAQQSSGSVNVDLILTGNDGLSAMEKSNELIRLLPNYASAFPGLQQRMDPGAWQYQQAGGGYGIVATVYGPAGPLLEYDPKQVPQVPQDPQALLAWAKAHPNKFVYANPDNSGPGRTFLMGLPYLLGDANPQDPEHGWDKTWAYLGQLGQYIRYYPSSTKETMTGLANGTFAMTASQVAFDTLDRSNGTLPASTEAATFANQQWISDGHYSVIPKGVDPGHIAVVLDLLKWLMRPDKQATGYAHGELTFPVTGVSPAMAGPQAQQIYQTYGRPDYYPRQFATHSVRLPLSPVALQEAFDLWNSKVGAAK